MTQYEELSLEVAIRAAALQAAVTIYASRPPEDTPMSEVFGCARSYEKYLREVRS